MNQEALFVLGQMRNGLDNRSEALLNRGIQEILVLDLHARIQDTRTKFCKIAHVNSFDQQRLSKLKRNHWAARARAR